MLDEKTLEWLEEREARNQVHAGYFCKYCCHGNFDDENFFYCDVPQSGREDEDIGFCPIYLYDAAESYVQKLKSLIDAAEFEARVAAKLADPSGPEPCEHEEKHYHCPWPRSVIEGKRTCSFCRMKYARIEVEREMDRP